MTEVSTHLFYGVFATTSSLLIASEAFSRVQLPFLAIDLILSRKSNSTLQVQVKPSTRSNSGNGDITRFPEEIWGMIRHELIGIELVESEKGFVLSLLCDHCKHACMCCRDYYREFDDEAAIPTTWKALLATSLGCEICFEVQADIFRWGLWDEDRGYIQKVKKFLSSFNLNLIANGKVEDDYLDLDSLSPIGILKTISHSCEPFEESTPFHAITSLSSTTLDLPSSPDSIARSFKTIRTVYGLEFGDHRTKTKKSQPNANLKKKEQVGTEGEGDELYKIPSWNLWTRGINIW